MRESRLENYFQPSGQKTALDAYRAFATSSAWSIPHKIDLYVATITAFDGTKADAEAFAAFELIYGSLSREWQVFRPYGAAKSWSARKVFDTVKSEFRQFGWGGSSVALPQFLHFYNPSLFPIYDTEVIWNRVFHEFKAEYGDFCTSCKLESKAEGASFLRNYLVWGSSLLCSAHPAFMDLFVEWLQGELPPRKFASLSRQALGSLYAAAFEFTIIGAALLERGV